MSVVRRYALLALAIAGLWTAPACDHEPDPIGAVDADIPPGVDAAANAPDASPFEDGGPQPCHDAGIEDAGVDGGFDAGMDADIPDAGVDAGMDDDGGIPDAGRLPPCPDAG